ncbi:SRPBCC family protein [Amycolatopsis rubida]|uniref:Carbon monoxide dehydrogenase subunit G n=1 Tax=Amycolatopsis rubida TaxID=112413 RepID=A0A1I5GJ03_9PSEU|nr:MULTISPECIES: SRPBCC family protein [Amycolatopsis]MYW97573.1 hypothetical protein [Amycolatopsis rubida]NEC62558.1 SRPBCC family protein [Amycolatopsis rubida]OAP27425.1 Carbon monoxide dehydrogenase subunit G (CoxG) [Amycolatopsis sp. M39]SFO35893.1 Carbon monoxide dehydrogenase subunit G [Amycolatopsis rubida]
MRLDHSFTVPAEPDEAWRLFLDLDRMVPCLPGAVLDRSEGDSFAGRVKVKVGAVQMSYQGAGTVNRDETTRTVTLDLEGRESRGSGTASATVIAVLAADPAGTLVRVRTELDLTGRPAQFGRGILTEVSDRIVRQFTARLADALEAPEAPVRYPLAPAEPEAVDLGAAALPVLLKKAAVPAAAIVAVAVLVRLLRRR